MDFNGGSGTTGLRLNHPFVKTPSPKPSNTEAALARLDCEVTHQRLAIRFLFDAIAALQRNDRTAADYYVDLARTNLDHA